MNSFPPGLKNDTSVYGGKVVCAKPSGFVVTGQTTWGRDGGRDRRNNTGPLPVDSGTQLTAKANDPSVSTPNQAWEHGEPFLHTLLFPKL